MLRLPTSRCCHSPSSLYVIFPTSGLSSLPVTRFPWLLVLVAFPYPSGHSLNFTFPEHPMQSGYPLRFSFLAPVLSFLKIYIMALSPVSNNSLSLFVCALPLSIKDKLPKGRELTRWSPLDLQLAPPTPSFRPFTGFSTYYAIYSQGPPKSLFILCHPAVCNLLLPVNSVLAVCPVLSLLYFGCCALLLPHTPEIMLLEMKD